MPKEQSKEQNASSRIALIKIIKTPLAFYVLIALIAEAILGVLATSTEGQIQEISLYGLIVLFLLLVIIVTLLTFLKPGSLLGSFSASPKISDFCDKITGDWWEKVTPDVSTALSYVKIKHNIETNTVKMHGTTYNLKGELIANWETAASCISLNDSKVFYYWKGHHTSNPGIPYEGFGEITFDDSQKKISKGKGLFSDTNLTDFKTFQWKSTTFRRCSSQEIGMITKGDNKQITSCIIQVLPTMS